MQFNWIGLDWIEFRPCQIHFYFCYAPYFLGILSEIPFFTFFFHALIEFLILANRTKKSNKAVILHINPLFNTNISSKYSFF